MQSRVGFVSAEPCPCGQTDAVGRALPLARCCGRFFGPQADAAPDAQALMRSRYSAFVLQRAEYLLVTWHPSRRPAHIGFEPGVKWLGLELRQYLVRDARHADVECVARQRQGNGRAVRLHERSRFECADGRWYYVDGDLL